MLNKICIMGRLTADPELRYTQSGLAVASYTVAVDRDYQQGGSRETDFIACVSWRQGAEFVSKYFHKGSMIVVEGRLQSRKWQDRDGNNRVSWEIMTEHTYFGESRQQQGGQYQQQYQQPPQYQTPQGYYQPQNSQQYQQAPPQNWQPAGNPRNVDASGWNEMDGPGDDNPFVGQQQPPQQQYGGQQAGMWDDLNDEADGELPF